MSILRCAFTPHHQSMKFLKIYFMTSSLMNSIILQRIPRETHAECHDYNTTTIDNSGFEKQQRCIACWWLATSNKVTEDF